MLLLDHKALRGGFEKVLKEFYPDDTACILAAMHTEMHLKFAMGISSVPPDTQSAHVLVRAQAQTARRIRKIRIREGGVSHELTRAVKKDLENEIRDWLESVGPERAVEFNEVFRATASFGTQSIGTAASIKDVRTALRSLITQKLIVRFGKTRGARYRWKA